MSAREVSAGPLSTQMKQTRGIPTRFAHQRHNFELTEV
jgi:hypothetical protein